MLQVLKTPIKDQPVHETEVLPVPTENNPSENVVEASVQNATRDTTRFSYGDGTFLIELNGIFYEGKDKFDNIKQTFVCGPLRIVAETRNEKSSEWGRLLEWVDLDGKIHRWAMPMELLKENGVEMRGELMRQGLRIPPEKKARDQLSIYIQMCPTDKKAICVNRLGWYGKVYVLPDTVIGETDEITVFQHGSYIEPAFSQKGSLDEWKEHVAKWVAGNSRLIFALSAAFAAPLIEMAGMESGGFHFRGASSSGKTTAMHVAASVYGHPNKYVRQWRATANGLEGVAAIHNDGLLILDEISQVDSKSASEVAYMLANGQGKTRANRHGMAKEPFSWRVTCLSTGEESLSAIVSKSGGKSNAGQEVRMADIESDAGAGMGIFEDIHEKKNASDFAVMLKENAALYHGTVGRVWIEKLVADRQKWQEEITQFIDDFVSEVLPKGADGQVIRVARRFALNAYAGELAIELGFMGLEECSAKDAAETCFKSWLENFGGEGNREARAILERTREVIERYGSSHFENLNPPEDGKERYVSDRIGFYRDVKDSREFLFPVAAYKEYVCGNFSQKTVSAVLKEHGYLQPDGGGKNSHSLTIPSIGGGKTRCYVIKLPNDERTSF